MNISSVFLFFCLILSLNCISQVDVELFAKEKRFKEDGENKSIITFDLFIINNSESTVYFPYNAVPINNSLDETNIYKHLKNYNPIERRFNNLIQSNDSIAIFFRDPIVKSFFHKSVKQLRYAQFLHLNYYGYSKGVDQRNGHIELTKLLKIESGKKFHIKSIFQFDMKKRYFSYLLKSKKYGTGFYVKVVLFKEGLPENIMTGNLLNMFGDLDYQENIIHKLFCFSKWESNSKMEAENIPIESSWIKFGWEEPVRLDMLYYFGGW